MKTRPVAIAFAVIILFLQTQFTLAAQQSKQDEQNQFGGVADLLKKEAAEKALGSLLNEQLPLKLDAKTAFHTVNALPGGPFQPKPLQLTAADMDTPLAPGDYTLQVQAFCTEYSVHRPGNGIAYEIAPMQGKAAPAIAALLWRGTIEKHRPPQELQAVAWAIQSGLRYAQMPQSYQTVINVVIPDYINEFSGDFVQSAEDTYTNLARGTKLPTLDQLLGGMGKPGQLMLSAERQRAALLRQNTTDEIKTQTLFAGQDAGVAAPVKASNAQWTERIPGMAYMRYTIVGGNLATNNTMEIRILPQEGADAAPAQGTRLVNAAYRVPAGQSAGVRPTPAGLMSGVIGYPIGAGAQDLVPIPVVSNAPPVVGSLQRVKGAVQVCKPDGTCKTVAAGDSISMGDSIVTGPGGDTEVVFADKTMLTMAEKSKIKIDEYIYDPKNPSGDKASYSILQGAFRYVSGLIAKKDNDNVRMDTAFGCLGIRGTEFIMKAGGSEIDLVEGTVATGANPAAPHTPFTGPVKIVRNAAGAQGSAVTQAQYDAIKKTLFPQ